MAGPLTAECQVSVAGGRPGMVLLTAVFFIVVKHTYVTFAILILSVVLF